MKLEQDEKFRLRVWKNKYKRQGDRSPAFRGSRDGIDVAIWVEDAETLSITINETPEKYRDRRGHAPAKPDADDDPITLAFKEQLPERKREAPKQEVDDGLPF